MVDGHHPRHLGYLSHQCTDALIGLCLLIEAAGDFPTIAQSVLNVLLGKPQGVGPSDWTLPSDLPRLDAPSALLPPGVGAPPRQPLGLWCLSFTSLSDAVWRQGLRAEAGRNRARSVHTLLWGLKKCYDHIRGSIVSARAREVVGYPHCPFCGCPLPATVGRGAFNTTASLAEQ